MIARLALCLLLSATPAAAAVKSASPTSFELENRLVTKAPPADVFAALGRIGAWWNPDHTHGGKAEALSIELKPGGCFCETLGEGGFAEHMRVVFVRPNDMLRLQGGLGPLQAEGVQGSMTWSLKPTSNGGTEITHTYVVGGFVRGGAERFAAPVDRVQADHLARLGRYLETRALRTAE